MPRGDGTGPMGMGSMTGRAAGYCAGYGVPGFMNALPGRGYGGGYGRGRGRGMYGLGRGRGFGRGLVWGAGPGYYAPQPTGYGPVYPQAEPQSERQYLENEANVLQEELEGIKQRLAELEAQEAKKE
jgi:uncharacterized protein DUF5320